MEFSRQEYWSGLPFPSPGDLPNPGIEPGSPALQADSLPTDPPGKPQTNTVLYGNYISTGKIKKKKKSLAHLRNETNGTKREKLLGTYTINYALRHILQL